MTDVLVALGASLVLAFVVSGPKGRAPKAVAPPESKKASKVATPAKAR
jgi:hypothetical protein